jgi:MFS family permease
VKGQSETRSSYGWVVVATAAFGLFLGVFPIFASSFTVFFPAFVREFHAGRGAISLAFAVCNLVTACLAPIVGRLCDRIGARPVILTSLSLFGLGLIASRIIGCRLWELYVFTLIIGIAASGTNSIPYGLVVSRWFNRRRGLALGLMMIGLGAGAIVIPPLARILIAWYGWRATYAGFGWAALTLAVPVVSVFLKEKPLSSSPKSSSTNDAEGWSWREIRGSADFWRMILVFVLVSASVQACFIHMTQIMLDRGATASLATVAASVSGGAILAGRVSTGYFLDRYSGAGVARVIFASAALGIALLSMRGAGVMFAGAFLVGLGLGAEADIIAYLLGRHFGLRSFGTAFGFAFGLFVLAGGVGPLLMGVAFDRSGSYQIALTAFCMATALAALLVGRLGPYRFAVKGEN